MFFSASCHNSNLLPWELRSKSVRHLSAWAKLKKTYSRSKSWLVFGWQPTKKKRINRKKGAANPQKKLIQINQPFFLVAHLLRPIHVPYRSLQAYLTLNQSSKRVQFASETHPKMGCFRPKRFLKFKRFILGLLQTVRCKGPQKKDLLYRFQSPAIKQDVYRWCNHVNPPKETGFLGFFIVSSFSLVLFSTKKSLGRHLAAEPPTHQTTPTTPLRGKVAPVGMVSGAQRHHLGSAQTSPEKGPF